MESLISVIVPIYNTEQYLRQCLDSIVNQTYKSLEIILVNDGSTDGSGEICDEYAAIDKRVTVVHQENQGLVKSRKIGFLKSKGQYIGFVDSDDWIDETMYECLYQDIENNQVDFVSTAVTYEYEDNGQTRYVGHKGVYKRYSDEMPSCKNMFYSDVNSKAKLTPHIWNKLFTRDIFDKYYMLIPDDITICEDACFTYSAVPFLESFYISDRSFYHYRQHNESMMNAASDYYLKSINKFYLYLHEQLGKHEQSNLLLNELDRHYSAMVLRTITKFLPKKVVEDFILCHHFPLEYLLKGEKVVIYGEKNIANSYFKQLNNKKNLIIKLANVINSEILNWGFDYIIIAVEHENEAEKMKNLLLEEYHINNSRIIWAPPKRISDMIIAQ